MKNRIPNNSSNDSSRQTAQNDGSVDSGSDTSDRDRGELFLAFHTQNHNRISAFVHTLVPVWQDAEEIVQDTLVVLWRKFDEFDPSTSFFAWAAKVAQFEVLNFRRRNRHKEMVLDAEVLDSVAKTAIKQLDEIELHREALEMCIGKLPEQDRELILLRYREGGNIQATADSLHRTTGHVQRLLRKIRTKLLRCVHLRLMEFGN